MKNIIMKQYKFSDIDLSDPFFDTLKGDYPEFSEWFSKKSKTFDGNFEYSKCL